MRVSASSKKWWTAGPLLSHKFLCRVVPRGLVVRRTTCLPLYQTARGCPAGDTITSVVNVLLSERPIH
jgi:hypothetical protein